MSNRSYLGWITYLRKVSLKVGQIIVASLHVTNVNSTPVRRNGFHIHESQCSLSQKVVGFKRGTFEDRHIVIRF